MYEQRFHLKRRPFPATPDDSLYYPATGHESALQTLARAVEDDEGILLLTGEPGTGKTLLGHCLTDRLGAACTSALLTHSHLVDRIALLQAVLFDLSLPFEDASEQVLRLRLTDHLLKNCALGKRFVLLVDEAHHLRPELLEELRLLGNLEAAGKKAFQVLLLAQPSIGETLKKPELSAVQQRLAVRCLIEPLGVEESLDYLLHHLRLAGGKPEKIVEEPALEALARGTHGVPRLLNQAAHQALLLADAAELPRVDAEAALEALTILGLATETEEIAPLSDESTSFEVGAKPQAGETTPFRLAEETRRSA
jgi:type II secretory pathway predicted ATPase ExeA